MADKVFRIQEVNGREAIPVKMVDNGDGTYSLSTTSVINGDIIVGAEVEVNNDEGNPLPVAGTVTANVGTTNGLALAADVTALGVLNGAVDEAAPASDVAASGLNGRLQRIAQRLTSMLAVLPAALGQAAMAASTPVVIASNQSDIRAIGRGYSSRPNFNRTADTNAYIAGDVVGSGTGSGGAVLTFPNMGVAGEDIIITDCDLLIDRTTIPAGLSSYRLHLYNATPPSALADNAPWDLPTGDQAAYLGFIDFGSPVDLGSSLFVQSSGVNKKLRMGASSSLFGYLQTITGYTPASATTHYPRLNAVGC